MAYVITEPNSARRKRLPFLEVNGSTSSFSVHPLTPPPPSKCFSSRAVHSPSAHPATAHSPPPHHPVSRHKRTTTIPPPQQKSQAYPYGPAQWYKQADTGLYGGQRIRFGNNVGPKSGTKTRRKWAVNVFRKRLFSKALNTMVQIRVSKRVLRTIDKVGGLDQYLLGEKEARVRELGLRGWELRWALMQTEGVRKGFRKEGLELGLRAVEKRVEKLEARRQLADLSSEEAVEEDVEDGLRQYTEEEQQREAEGTQLPKVRIASGKYFYLTPEGWRAKVPRVKETGEPDKADLIRKEVRPQMQAARAVLRAHNAALQGDGKIALSRKERERVLWQVKKTLRTEMSDSPQLQEKFEEKQESFALATEKKLAIQARVEARRSKETNGVDQEEMGLESRCIMFVAL